MIDVATLSVIRRWALREQLSIREIARRTGLSRNTIRKYLRAGEAEPHYAKRVSPSKLDPFASKLSGWLKTEAGRSRKQRRTVKQIYADLQALGYTGSYNRVAAFVRLWQEQRLVAQQTTGRGTFVPLAFGPGEAFQFDWSEDWAVLAGVRTKLQVAHFKLSHSRAFYLRAYLLQTHEMLFDAHKPGALRNGAPFLELPAAFKRLQAALVKQPGGDREMVEVLALVLHHDEQAVLAAVELALESGAASKTHIALAKQRGAYRGRKKSLPSERIAELRQRVEAGEQKTKLAREFGISRETLYQYLRTNQ